jgi:hypothetical protein
MMPLVRIELAPKWLDENVWRPIPMTLDPSTPRSRRAILAAAAGAAAATVVGAVTKPSTVRAAGNDGATIHVGDTIADARSQTTLANQLNNNIVLYVASNPDSGGGGGAAVVGYSDSGVGVAGGLGVFPITSGGIAVTGNATGTASGVKGQANGTGIGVIGYSVGGSGVAGTSSAAAGVGVSGTSSTGTGTYGSTNSGIAVHGYASASGGIGVWGESNAGDKPAVAGRSLGGSTGVLGFSGATNLPSPKTHTGVYGYAAQDDTSRGVWGETTSGHAVHGTATSGYAGFFNGKVYTSKFHEMQEVTIPTAPVSNHARLFLKDNGSGKTQLCVRFHTGAVQVLSTQP